MNRIEKHYDLLALTQMPVLSQESILELQQQLRMRLDRELTIAREEAVWDLLELSTEELQQCSEAARAVAGAHCVEGADTESAEAQYFLKHPEVLELYLPQY